jgi:hypothetical protein
LGAGGERRARADLSDPRDGSGPFLPGVAEVSPQTQELLDYEVRRIVAESHDEVVNLLTEDRAWFDWRSPATHTRTRISR